MMLRSKSNADGNPQGDLRHQKRKQNEQLEVTKNILEPAAKKQGMTELRTFISGFKIDSAKRGKQINVAPSTSKALVDPCPHFDFDKQEGKNPDSVPEYAADIFAYYRSREKFFRVYSYFHKHPQIDPKARAILVDWMVEIQETFELNHETLYNAVKMTDLYLSKTSNINKHTIQKLACVTIFTAAKFDERQAPLVDDLIYLSGDIFSRGEFLAMERDMFSTIGYDLGSPSSYRYLRRLGRVCHVDMAALTLARYILETSLLIYEYSLVSQCRLASAAFLLAMRMLNKKNEYTWNAVLEKYSGFTEDEVVPLMEHMNHVMHHVTSKWTQLVTIRQKYSHEIFHSVAEIPLLPDTLVAPTNEEIAPVPVHQFP